jgi:VWFA-related protein
VKVSNLPILLGIVLAASPLMAQNDAPESNTPVTTLQLTAHAVLVDVVVTDHNGAPVTGLQKDAFTLTEEGKPQTIAFFEEHKGAPTAQPVELPNLPPDVFSNFSPLPRPAAVNVLLLDSLNTPMSDQAYIHAQALKYLKSLKPGSRMAIFTMSLGLRFVQGFTDDPALLASALGNKKKNEIETPSLIKSPQDSLAQQTLVGQMSEIMPAGPGGTVTASTTAMIDAMNGFFERTDQAQEDDRAYRTLANLQQLAVFLQGFPGRKNLIWFSESFPLVLFGVAPSQFAGTDTRTETRFEGDMKKTVDLLTAARVAVYPVDARGTSTNGIYQAGSTFPPVTTSPAEVTGPNGAQSQSLLSEGTLRNADQEAMKTLARDTGGRAFVNTNGFTQVIASVVSDSSDFYTLSYTPENRDMDGLYRRVDVKLAGPKYSLAYRRGYYAEDLDLPGAKRPTTAADAGPDDPLRPFMEFGMPQTEQVLYKCLIHPVEAAQEPPSTADVNPTSKGQSRYSLDFAVDLKDLRLQPTPEGLHKGNLNLTIIVYDRYGHTVSRKDHVVALNIKPNIYEIFQKTGVQLHDSIDVPKGQFWVRTGVYDQASHKVGTMEVPLNQVKPLQTASK